MEPIAVPMPHADDRVVASAQEAEALLVIDSLGIAYGSGKTAKQVVQNLSLTVHRREFVCVVGPSGVGKTSLIRCIVGIQRPTQGQVSLRGDRVRGPREGVAFVSQDYSRSLMPWLKIGDNVVLPLRGKGLAKAEIKSRRDDALAAVGLAHASDMYAWQLSGGMQQRVSIARALAYRPELLVMDEPFASVDAQTRADLEDLVLRLQHEIGVTTVLITHDIDTAVYVADRVVVIGGKPASVIDEVETGLGRNRDQIATKSSAAFIDGRSRVLLSIRSAQESHS